MKTAEKMIVKGIQISQNAADCLIEQTNQFEEVETGGVLCGFYEKEKIIINSISGPGPGAFQSVDGFIIDKDFMDKFLDQEYQKSNGLNIYVGEWHTHPQKFPIPSHQDIQSFVERTFEWQLGELVFIIIGFVGFNAKNLKSQIIGLKYDQTSDEFWKLPIEFI